MLRVTRVEVPDSELLEPLGSSWERLETHRIDLIPAPVGLAAGVSLQITLSQGHGKVPRVATRMAHNGDTLSIRLAWDDPHRDDRIRDLDRFVDAAAVLFPLVAETNPLTMGEETKPVNAWFWKADREEPFDVIARGFSTSQRRPARASGLAARGVYRDGGWVVVFQRPLEPGGADFVQFQPGGSASIGFAVWEGSNADRSGQKATSAVFTDLKLDR